MRKKFIKSVATLSIMALFASFASLKVNAQTNGILTIQEKNEISNVFRADGLEEDTISNLIEKLDNGEQLDSMSSEKESVSKEISTNIAGEQVERAIYEDGSYSITYIEVLKERASVSGGSTSSGSGYQSVKGAKVHHTTGVITSEFYADFTYVTGGKSYISRVYDYKIKVLLGSYTLNSFDIEKKNQDGSGPATAALRYTVRGIGNSSQTSYYLKLCVNSYNSYVEHDF